MTPQELKNSILQLAIQGKLVEQHPEEGTAEELYQQIQAEKKKLIADGKIKKEKPLPEITEDEKPFDIPESWKWVRLGECTSYAESKLKVSPNEITSDMWSLDLEDIEKETGHIHAFCNATERKITGEKVRFFNGTNGLQVFFFDGGKILHLILSVFRLCFFKCLHMTDLSRIGKQSFAG